MQFIPFKEPAQWSEQIQLSSTIYNLVCQWNALNKYWTMDVLTRDQVPLVVGIKIVVNYNLLKQYSVFGLPAGDTVCQSIIGSFAKLGRFDMDRTAELVYYEPGQFVVTPA
jgi:hypothetical protein